MTDIFEVVNKITNLPPFPKTVQRALDMLKKPEVSNQQLAQVLMYDQAVTANVLRLCNSAYFGLNREVTSLRDGLTMLGHKNAHQLLVASGILPLYQGEHQGYCLAPGELWQHSMAVATMAELLGEKVDWKDLPLLFTAALLHDIGKLVLAQFVAEEFLLIQELVGHGKPFTEAEGLIIGMDHGQLGGLIALEWKFPEPIVSAITFHHEPEKAPTASDLTALVHLANNLVLFLGVGVGVGGLSMAADNKALQRFNLTQNDLDMLLVMFYPRLELAQRNIN
ncbi:MAG: HDOD domain-containing protein [Deltaproteobacteria bacterium]|nr:HDOD domain-containing protein [Deltaproteobacteria bacterium]